jgi:hypothetical protein
MKAAKKGAVIKCDGIRQAIVELQNLSAEFDISDPEDVRTRIQAFASALTRSGLVTPSDEDEPGHIGLPEIIEALPVKEFDSHMAEVELFALDVSEYNEPDTISMKDGRQLLESFGPKLIAELERIEEECRPPIASSQTAPNPP